MFENGSNLGVAVSGGADSVFLLHLLRDLAPRWNLRLSVVHIEHGIRGTDSTADAEFVRQLARSFDLPFHLHTVNVTAIQDNLEQAARNARREFFTELISQGTVERIATGHTRNDQAETVLFRILRGSGLTGLTGILPVTMEGIVRPLLEADRAEIELWLRDRQIAWREDVTNRDLSYARNRLRHEILPLLRDAFNPQLDAALAHLAMLAQDEEAYWGSEPETNSIAGPQILNIAELASSEPALARRRVRKAIAQTKGDLRQIGFDHIERILQMVRSAEGHDRIQLPGVDVFRSFQWIRFAPLGPTAERDFTLPLQAPGCVELPGSGTRITLQVQEKSEQAPCRATLVDELDWQRFTPNAGALTGLELRNWRPGDQYRRVGHEKQEKIKILFQEARIPLWERRQWPIITYNETIVWVRRFGAAAEFVAGPASRMVLRIGESGSVQSGYRSGTP